MLKHHNCISTKIGRAELLSVQVIVLAIAAFLKVIQRVGEVGMETARDLDEMCLTQQTP